MLYRDECTCYFSFRSKTAWKIRSSEVFVLSRPPLTLYMNTGSPSLESCPAGRVSSSGPSVGTLAPPFTVCRAAYGYLLCSVFGWSSVPTRSLGDLNGQLRWPLFLGEECGRTHVLLAPHLDTALLSTRPVLAGGVTSNSACLSSTCPVLLRARPWPWPSSPPVSALGFPWQ